MKKLCRFATILISILLVLSLSIPAMALREESPWKDLGGQLGKADKRWNALWLKYLYLDGANAAIIVEGATANAYETTVSFTEPTADNTLTMVNDTGAVMISELTTNAPDAANSIWGESNKLVFEGATANAFEMSVTVVDPTVARTVTLPDYSGSVPLIVAQGYTQTSHGEASTVDVTGGALTLADGWFTEGKTLQFKMGGTVTGANDTISALLYFEDAAVMTLTSTNAAEGDWEAEFTILATGAATQRIHGKLIAEAGAELHCDYATDNTNTAAAGTIPAKLQVALADGGDAITVEWVQIAYWNKSD